jgi:Ca-activated chloride channel family protein
MENQDKIYHQFQQAAKNAEGKPVPELDKIWARVEEKLDKKESEKPVFWWKKLAVAASLLLILTLGYQLFSDEKVVLPQENPVVESPKSTEPTETAPIENTIERFAPTTDFDAENTEKILKEDKVNSAVALEEENIKEDQFLEKEVVEKASEVTVSSIVLEENNIETKSSLVTTTVNTNPISGEKTINGVVTSKNDGLPLPGVSILIKGTSKGTQTDYDGKFSLKVNLGDQLVFNYIGFNESIVTISKKETITVALEESSANLSEVVVVSEGYNRGNRIKNKAEKESAKKSEQKLAVGIDYVIQNNSNSDKIVAVENKANSSILQSLQGQSPGLTLISSSGTPGSTKFNAIRGVSSTQNNTDPLLVIDGVPASASTFRKLDANNIKEVTVLKDAQATSIYGKYGRNGVIMITTNKGKLKKISEKELKKRLEAIAKLHPAASDEIKSNEDYESFEENAFESPSAKPLSTFSIDVDNASYTNIRRFINNGQKVPKDAVRVEEMINFFKYNNPAPTNNDPFAITTEYAVAPWNAKHKLLRIGLQGKNIPTNKLPASNLVFLIDVSGSMNDQNKLPLLKESMKILVKELRKEDKVSIIVYAGATGMVLPPTSGDEKQTIINALEKLSAGGSTAGGAGIELAYKTAQENFIKNGNNRVILATDGDFNVGISSNGDMQTLIEEKRKSGVFLTCLGYGMGNYKDSKMELLSDKGNGNYAYIDNIQEANRFLGKEFKGSMFAIAKDVKIQIEFNPKHVKSYRLIGYENRKLRDEDFTNDAIDAGELGSGHTVTALYEIIPTGVASEFYQEEIALKYGQNNASASNFNDELATIKFRYKKPDGEKSIEMVKVIENKALDLNTTSSDFKFCSAVAWFGLTLRDSKLISNKDMEAIKSLAKKGLENDDEGYKAEFIRLVESAK